MLPCLSALADYRLRFLPKLFNHLQGWVNLSPPFDSEGSEIIVSNILF